VTVKDSEGFPSSSIRARAESIPTKRRNQGSSEKGGPDGFDSSGWTQIELDGLAEAIDPIELKEFLEADWTHIQADPGFKAKLRSELWRVIDSWNDPKKDEDPSS
jgi:hypothetical protein